MYYSNKIFLDLAPRKFKNEPEMKGSDLKAIVETYAVSRNELNPKTLRGKLTKCWDPVVVYADPLMRVQGSKELSGYMMQFQRACPELDLLIPIWPSTLLSYTFDGSW